jgi:CubicO group peptidase (beta-lactamase class C family)
MRESHGSILSIAGIVVLLITVAAHAQIRERSQESAQSGTFHLSQTEPVKRLAFSGRTGIVRINNFGPAALAVSNKSNNVTLGAHSRFDLTFDGETILAVSSSAATQTTDGTFEIAPALDPSPQVDLLFSEYNREGSPGCALAVIRDGHIIYEKGYGMANLEYAIPVDPGTLFHVASISKQFTAFAIHLLAAEKKVSIDDDVRRYLSELHNFGKVITINQLLHHTSGLRDQWTLLNLAGWRSGDIITEDDILGLVWRQKELNFEPGSEELYSNTAYTLLAEIVQRVSGRTLRQFCAERLFGPLGMKSTHFSDDNTEVVPGRAYSYSPGGPGGFSNVPLQYANFGATGLLTTVEDLALWDRNFNDERVGGASVLDAMLKKGMLSSGAEISYASGLSWGEYRGLKTLEHGGSDAGFRADYLRFPHERLSIVLLSNLASVDAGGLARKVADIYLSDRLNPLPKTRASVDPVEVRVDPKIYDSYCGDYLLRPDLTFTFFREGDKLWLQPSGMGKMMVFPLSQTEFFFKGISARFRFVIGKDGKAESVVLSDGAEEMNGPRFTRPVLKPAQLEEYIGVYYSDELNATCVLSKDQNGLTLRYPRGAVTLDQIQPDTFVAGYPLGKVQFVRDSATGRVKGFKSTTGRVRNLAFHRTRSDF